MILIRPVVTADGHEHRWHAFEREDASERWITTCGCRLMLARFQSGPSSYITCKRCAAALAMKGAA